MQENTDDWMQETPETICKKTPTTGCRKLRQLDAGKHRRLDAGNSSELAAMLASLTPRQTSNNCVRRAASRTRPGLTSLDRKRKTFHTFQLPATRRASET